MVHASHFTPPTPCSTLIIVWRITEACDLACPFCAYDRNLHRPRASANPEQVLAFGAVLGEYANTYSRDILVSWLGGEPLRWPPLFEISRTFKHDCHLRLSATTNGTALTSEKIHRTLAENFDELTISLDGLDTLHDQLRGAPGLFAQLRENIAALRAVAPHLRLRVNTLLLRDNIHAFPDLCETLADWGIAELTFNALGGRDRPEFYPAHSLHPEQVAAFRAALPALRARLAPRGLALLGSDAYLDRLSASAANYHLPITSCSPGTDFLFINEHGYFSPCSFTTNSFHMSPPHAPSPDAKASDLVMPSPARQERGPGGEGYGLHLSTLCTTADLHHLPTLFAERQRTHRLPICDDCPSTQVFGKFMVADF